MEIPKTFDNFKQRQLSRGLETMSETEYKGYIIMLRCYSLSGITAKIIKGYNDRRILLRQQCWTFYEPIKLLEKMKNYIDNYEINLINTFNKRVKQ
jgi:hypothetical protein